MTAHDLHEPCMQSGESRTLHDPAAPPVPVASQAWPSRVTMVTALRRNSRTRLPQTIAFLQEDPPSPSGRNSTVPRARCSEAVSSQRLASGRHPTWNGKSSVVLAYPATPDSDRHGVRVRKNTRARTHCAAGRCGGSIDSRRAEYMDLDQVYHYREQNHTRPSASSVQGFQQPTPQSSFPA